MLKTLIKIYIILVLLSSIFLFSHIFHIFKDIFLFFDINLITLNFLGYTWYESIKVISFVFLSISLVTAIILNTLIIIRKWNFYFPILNINMLFLVSIIIWIFISSIFSININQDYNSSFFWASNKLHTIFFYLSLVVFYMSINYLKSLNSINNYKTFFKNIILKTLFISVILLAIYSIIQKLNLDPLFTQSIKSREPLTRAFATLWNANYLAWFSLILIPISFLFRNIYLKISFFLLNLWIIILSWSIYWIVLVWAYILYVFYIKCLNTIFPIYLNRGLRVDYLLKILYWIWIIILIYFSYNYISVLNHEKIYWAIARVYMWQTSILASVDNIKVLLIWYWPDTMIQVFDMFKVPELSIYEDKNYTADSSHNVFLDLIFSFWIITSSIIFYLVFKIFLKLKNNNIKSSILLFLLFFSFNPVVLVHLILFLLLTSF